MTDHTARLAGNWKSSGCSVRIIADTKTPPESLADELQREHSALLIQYVPFLYGRRGLSRYPQRLVAAARARSLRVTVFVHETWVPRTRLPWLGLVETASATVTPVPAWLELLPGATLVRAGSNMPPPEESQVADRLESPVVFSPLAAGLRRDWIQAAARAIRAEPLLQLIGARHGDEDPYPGAKWLGYLSPTEVTATLARAPLVMAPFFDGLTSRRGSAMAALAAGARLVSNRGHLYDPMFDDAPCRLADTEEEFVGLAVDLYGESDTPAARKERIAWYEEHLSAAQLDEQLRAIVLDVATEESRSRQ
ncbi:MAG: hypothetical protein ACE5FJ_05535 [Gemmatimonadales bacterium]